MMLLLNFDPPVVPSTAATVCVPEVQLATARGPSTFQHYPSARISGEQTFCAPDVFGRKNPVDARQFTDGRSHRKILILNAAYTVKGVDTRTLRAEWRFRIGEVTADTEALVVFNRGRAEAVLLSGAAWLGGCRKIPVSERDQRYWAASDARSGLSAARTAAYVSGQHTLIRKLYGTLLESEAAAEPEAVIAPYEWALRALPELRDLLVERASARQKKIAAMTPYRLRR
ncbi:hypothetical protein [Nocardia sp. NPDC046763]|uniref:hypothetical protein n=1 Tax=Nocardia sp. NPDC046763 TaxID=3155256 RepID=UPI0033F63768